MNNHRIRVGLEGTQGLEYVYDNDPDHPVDPEEIKKRALMDWVRYGPSIAMRGGIAIPPPYSVDVRGVKTEWEESNKFGTGWVSHHIR